MARDAWVKGDAYELYVGRWSTTVAHEFVGWLGLPADLRWLDAGCGTGALTAKVLERGRPRSVTGADPSEGFLAKARERVEGARFCVADAQALPFADNAFDVVVSGLALNFVPDEGEAVAEFLRVATVDGVVAGYVWDYADGMAMMRYFWDAAAALDPDAAGLDEGRRFPLCRPEPLRALWVRAGLGNVGVRAIDVDTVFADFNDLWTPFLGGQGPAPAYTMSLRQDHRDALRDLLRARIPTNADGTITLTARAWAVRGGPQ
jgi:SAM-dependent methyltransferase